MTVQQRLGDLPGHHIDDDKQDQRIDRHGPLRLDSGARNTARIAAIQMPIYGTKRSNAAITPNSSAPGTPMIASPMAMIPPALRLAQLRDKIAAQPPGGVVDRGGGAMPSGK